MNPEEGTKMLLFAKWLACSYADEHLDKDMKHQSEEGYDSESELSVLNRENGKWYLKQLKFFNEEVYSNYINNGSAQAHINYIEKEYELPLPEGRGFLLHR